MHGCNRYVNQELKKHVNFNLEAASIEDLKVKNDVHNLALKQILTGVELLNKSFKFKTYLSKSFKFQKQRHAPLAFPLFHFLG